MPTVAAIPPELWEQIITAACTDGGFTGISLALTNKFFHEQSLSNRFYSLAFKSIERIEAFFEFLAARPNKPQPKIQHLYLSFVKEPDSAWHAPLNLWLNWSRERLDKAYQDHNTIQETRSQRFSSAMTRLLALAGPHLRTLCILEPTHFNLPPLPTLVLPKLQELTVEGGSDFLVPAKKPSDGHKHPPHAKSESATAVKPEDSYPPLSTRFPSLERLHCVGRNWFKPMRVLADLAAHAPPSFTHLRFSGMATAASKFPPDLAMRLGVRLESFAETHEPALALDAGGGVDAAGRLPHLRHVVIQGMEPEPRTMRGFLSERWAGMCGDLREIARESREARGLQMVVLSSPWCRDPRWEDWLFDDWTDRLGGGCGCWVGSAEEEMDGDVHGDEHSAGIGQHEPEGVTVNGTDTTPGGPVCVP